MSLEIYYRDLNEVGKEKVNEFFKIEKAEDMNFDVCPLLIVEDDGEVIDVKVLASISRSIEDAQEGRFVE